MLAIFIHLLSQSRILCIVIPSGPASQLRCRISPAEVWKPDIALYNKQDLDHGILAADPRSANTAMVHIHSNGNIFWSLPVWHRVLCQGVSRGTERLNSVASSGETLWQYVAL